jgi:hypothetical protein
MDDPCKLLFVLPIRYSSLFRWSALLAHVKQEIIATAYFKLTNGEVFDDQNKYHVLALVSQRLCVDPLSAGVEALELADASVARHMRLLTGISPDGREFYTHSPSEPVLVLGAITMLYKGGGGWAPVLNTFSTALCDRGVVEKGLMGELGARTLLLVARDFAAPKGANNIPDLLQLVPLLDFFDTLFGNTAWCDKNREDFVGAFRHSYVNFTHWIVTKDPLPHVADE